MQLATIGSAYLGESCWLCLMPKKLLLLGEEDGSDSFIFCEVVVVASVFCLGESLSGFFETSAENCFIYFKNLLSGRLRLVVDRYDRIIDFWRRSPIELSSGSYEDFLGTSIVAILLDAVGASSAD